MLTLNFPLYDGKIKPLRKVSDSSRQMSVTSAITDLNVTFVLLKYFWIHKTTICAH